MRGEFVVPRQRLIHAIVARGSSIDNAIGAASRRRTLGGLWRGIVFESRVGCHLVTVTVRVVVEGHRDIADVFAATRNPEGSPAPGPLLRSNDDTPSRSEFLIATPTI